MKNITKKVLIGMTLVVIGTSAFLGITNSKYTNKITGSGETEIAKWNFVVNDSTEQMQTIKLADTYNQETLINGRIAPGTSGTFDLVLDASGAEVGVKYKVDFDNETNKPSNLKFKYNDKVFDEIEDYEDVFTGIIDADDTNKTRPLTVDWIWNYETQDNGNTLEENDKTDTLEGLDALDYSFDITVTGTQVIPTQNN